jgi:hypothetical protein
VSMPLARRYPIRALTRLCCYRLHSARSRRTDQGPVAHHDGESSDGKRESILGSSIRVDVHPIRRRVLDIFMRTS